MAAVHYLPTLRRRVSNYWLLARTVSTAPAIFAEMMLCVVRSAFLASLFILALSFSQLLILGSADGCDDQIV